MRKMSIGNTKRNLVVLLVALAVGFVWVAGGLAAEKQLVFGMACRDASAPFARAIIYGAQERADELGVKFLVQDSKDDTLKQIDQIDNFIAMGIDGYINNSAGDTRAIVAGIEHLNEANIPVMAVDSCPEGGDILYWFMNENVTSGKRAGETMIEVLKKKHGGKVPKGVIIEITGALGDAFSHDIGRGFHQAVDQYEQLTCAVGEGKWDNSVTFERVSDLLMRHGDEVVGVFVYTPDIMGSGAVNAIENMGYNPADYAMTGVCMGPEGLELINQGKYSAIVAQPCLSMGRFAVQYLYDHLKGNKLPQLGDVVTQEGALWSPAPVVKNPHANGLFVQLKGPMVPLDVSGDDPRLWENQVDKIMGN